MKQKTIFHPKETNTASAPMQLISLKTAARRLDISLRTLYRLIAGGQLPKPVRVGGSRKLYESDLVEYMSNLKRMN